MRTTPGRQSAFFCVALAAALGGEARAQLSFELTPVSITMRSHAPVAVDVVLKSDFEELLEGELHLDIVEDMGQGYGARRARYQSGDLALTTGEHAFRVLLPPMRLQDNAIGLVARGRFVTKSGSLDLGESAPLMVRQDWKRSFLVLAGEPPGQFVPVKGYDLFQAIDLDDFNPLADNKQQQDLTCTRAGIEPGEFPTNPHYFYPYDVLLLAAEGFTQLRSRQLDAVLQWVEAGGSVFVVPNRPMLDEHVAFLNALAGSSPIEPAYLADARGNVFVNHDSAHEKWATHHTGLGRALVLHGSLDPDSDLESPAWRSAVAFLWKLRTDQAEQVKQGPWYFNSTQQRQMQFGSSIQQFQDGTSSTVFSGGAVIPTDYHPYGPRPIILSETLRELLLPDRVQVVPFHVVALILVLFLAAIAPGDYFLLGFLKARKLTWVLFPIVSVAFTVFAIQLAQGYMGNTDHRTALVFKDMIVGNRVARTNRFELLFTATQRDVITPLKNRLLVPIEQTNTLDVQAALGQRGQSATRSIRLEPPTYAGRMPTAYEVHQQMPKWTPTLNRYSEIGGDASEFAFDFDSVSKHELTAPEGRRELSERIYELEPKAHVCVAHQRKLFDLFIDGAATRDIHSVAVGQEYGSIFSLPVLASVRLSEGLFAVVSQVSPNGTGNFEDLTLLDKSDPQQWLLLIVVPRGPDHVVYRRVYRIR